MSYKKCGCEFFAADCAGKTDCDLFTPEVAKRVRRYAKTLEQYEPTPLVALDELSKELNVKRIFVKDESYRMGLKAFKSIGVVYGVSKVLCKHLGVDIDDIDFDYFLKPEVNAKIKDIVLIAATDGNHGKGLAYAAKLIGCQCYIYMPSQTVPARIEAIENLGAEVTVTPHNYDGTLKLVIDKAAEMGWCHVQDQAWEGYTETTNFISQGYTAIADEIREQLDETKPTHIILQAGAGSFAVGIMAYYSSLMAENKPHMTIVEPDTAGCYMQSALANKFSTVDGDLETIMAGLSVGEPNIFAYTVLKDIVDYYITCPNEFSATGMRILANPMGDDTKVTSGDSGAVCLGVTYGICTMDALKDIREEMKLTKDSVLLFISTEGDTDPEIYKNIVWNGSYPLKA
ncbi:diaminopropionate ammonia-lyase [Desulfoluna butyratoxydans]|uniref:Diaminopropionate ammonia-lyase n=1 Tax=Desulfoluna butyratoxydans TaxID=231438 RepID=A0A4U8YLK7_9BACT|nr:diaminopropionate ammonia-lyase [Desulfoluna butyratoxydans]VFQ44581.1 diaminopropionate ammonia-lyase [Desulfoluna butyratoxydans]